MLTHNYVGLADRTIRPVGSKPKARAKADWSWKPYSRLGQMNSAITVYKVDRRFKSGLRVTGQVACGKPKREPRG